MGSPSVNVMSKCPMTDKMSMQTFESTATLTALVTLAVSSKNMLQIPSAWPITGIRVLFCMF